MVFQKNIKKMILLSMGSFLFISGCTPSSDKQSSSASSQLTEQQGANQDIDAMSFIHSPKHLPPVKSADLSLTTFKASEIEKDGIKFVHIDAGTFDDQEDYFNYQACASESNTCVSGDFQDEENLIKIPTTQVLKLTVKACVEDIRKVDESCGKESSTYVQRNDALSLVENAQLKNKYIELYQKEQEISKVISDLNLLYQDYSRNNPQTQLSEAEMDPFLKTVLGVVEIGPHTYNKILSGDDYKDYLESQGYKTYVCPVETTAALGLTDTSSAPASESLSSQVLNSSPSEGYARTAAIVGGVGLLAYGLYKIVPNWSDKPIYAAYGESKKMSGILDEFEKLPPGTTAAEKEAWLFERTGTTQTGAKGAKAFKAAHGMDIKQLVNDPNKTYLTEQKGKIKGELTKRGALWDRLLQDHAVSGKKTRLEVVKGELEVKDTKLAEYLDSGSKRIVVSRDPHTQKPTKFLDELDSKAQTKFLNKEVSAEAKSDLKSLTGKKRIDGKTAVMIGAIAIGAALTLFIAQDTLLKLTDDKGLSQQDVVKKSSDIHIKLENLFWDRDRIICDLNRLR